MDQAEKLACLLADQNPKILDVARFPWNHMSDYRALVVHHPTFLRRLFPSRFRAELLRVHPETSSLQLEYQFSAVEFPELHARVVATCLQFARENDISVNTTIHRPYHFPDRQSQILVKFLQAKPIKPQEIAKDILWALSSALTLIGSVCLIIGFLSLFLRSPIQAVLYPLFLAVSILSFFGAYIGNNLRPSHWW